MRTHFLPFHSPDLGDEELKAVEGVLRSGWLTTGSRVRQFESDFAQRIGIRHAIAVNSCTGALHLGLDTVGVREGDEVIVPTMTFAATAEVVHYFKARPVLVDCLEGTLNLDPDLVQRSITSKTKAIIPVHFGGHACDMDGILEIAREHGLRVVEDAAHAFPAEYKGQMIGTVGDLTCFSFYSTKTITTGEGGMITTQNDEYADRIRMMSLHGINADAWTRHTERGSWYYEILYPGYKYNMTDIAASIGIHQLKKCDRFWKIRRQFSEMYNDGFSNMPEIDIIHPQVDHQHAWHLYVIQLNLDRLRISRGKFIELLREENIGASVHFIPLHLHPFYRDSYGFKAGNFPNALEIYDRIVSLPLYAKMNDRDIGDVIEAVRKIVSENGKQ